jgi:CubicO group peptidase (beta-lactamase class C family)
MADDLERRAGRSGVTMSVSPPIAVMPDLLEVVVSQLSALVEGGEVASAAFAVVAGTAVHSGGFGGVDADSVFQIGSVTKAFIGLLLADSATRGEVKLSDPGTDYLPGLHRGESLWLSSPPIRRGCRAYRPGC